MNRNIGLIIQARTGSKRLPNKILKNILPGTTFLEFLISRLKKVKTVDKIIIATSNKIKDQKILKINAKGVFFYQGPELNVIKRFIGAANKYKIKHIIRITADCPFSDPELIDKFIKKYFKGNYKYVSNVNPPSFPNGFDVEVFALDILRKSFNSFKNPENKEHVTFAIRKSMSIKKYNFKLNNNLHHVRLTLDNKEDLAKIKKLAKHINIEDGWKSIYLKNKKINNEN